MNNIKILISAPIGGKKQYSINDWFTWIVNQDYDNYDIAICVNGEASEELKQKLNQTELKHKDGTKRNIIILELKNSNDISIIQRITYSRELLRRYAIKNNYDAVFWLDTDTIPLFSHTINKLIEWGKESVSGVYFYKNSTVPVVIDKETSTNPTHDKLSKFAGDNKLMEVWGTGYGCVLHRGRALNTPFDYKLFKENRTDDFGHCEALDTQRIKRYIDPILLCKHLDTPTNQERINKIDEYLKFK